MEAEKGSSYEAVVNGTPLACPLGLFIDNAFVASRRGGTMQLVNPADECILATLPCADADDVDRAVKAAVEAFEMGSVWRRTDARLRGRLLHRLADLVAAHALELALLESLNNGVARRETEGFHIPFAIACLRYFAGWCDKLAGQTLQGFPGDYLAYTRREPVGVVGAILPWNFPAMLLAWKMGPALAAGNCLIVKPSEATPLTALKMAELVREAGFPPGVFQVLPGDGPVAGEALARHPLVDKIALTGSVPTARRVLVAAAESNLKRVHCELGGKSPVIVFADADIDFVVRWAFMGAFLNIGENCCAGSRVLVEESLYDVFVERIAEEARKHRVGDPLDKETELGAIINLRQFEKVMSYIAIGKAEGARCVAGGNRIGTRGYFMEPTVFADVEDGMRICKEEIFGPVMCILKFADLHDAVRRANDSTYGLAAGVFTKDINKALSVAHALRAGTVWVNSYNMTDPASPFGGYKMSGSGRDLGQYAFEAYTEVKCVAINYGGALP